MPPQRANNSQSNILKEEAALRLIVFLERRWGKMSRKKGGKRNKGDKQHETLLIRWREVI